MQKLELTWVGKNEVPQVEPRILRHDPSKDYGDPDSQNMMIHGDNLLALKALEQDYAGKIKCIYIDPPFNTGARIDADGKEIGYDDGLEHSIWLDLMAARLKIIYNLLSDDGALFVHLDDNEIDYCRVLIDEIFGRRNFMNRITIDARSPSAFSTVNPGVFKSAEYILFYAKRRTSLVENQLRTERTPDYAYDKYIENIEDDYNNWTITSVVDAFEKTNPSATIKPQTALKNYNKFIIENASRIFRFTSISDTGAGQAILALKEESKKSPSKIFKLERENLDDVFILNGQQISFYKKNIALIDGKECASKILTDIWTDIAWEGIANEGGVRFKKGKKPERLIKRCLELVTSPGDIVLDSFLGSGTTAAVAHKMNRRWIGIEMGEHCYSLCQPRLNRIIDGADNSGISKIVNWQGGGGYKFYELAPTLIVNDHHGNPILSPQYNDEMLAEAVAKLNGFSYSPDPDTYWKQGHSQDNSYIYVSSQYLTTAQLDSIANDMLPFDQLLICVPAFDNGLNTRYDNISIRKIPQSILDKCEFSNKNYNLNIVNPPINNDDEEEANSND